MNLTKFCTIFHDKYQHSQAQMEEYLYKLEEEINQINERLDFEQKNSTEYQNLLKQERLTAQKHLEFIQHLEKRNAELENQIMVLEMHNKHRQSATQKKQSELEQLSNLKIMEDLKYQISNYKKEIIQLKEKTEELNLQYQRQALELSSKVNEIRVLQAEKLKSDSKIKFLEQANVKLNQDIEEQVQKCSTLEINNNQLNKQLYDLQNASEFNNLENDLEKSTFIRNSLNVSNNTCNLKCDLPELSYREPIPVQQIEPITEVSETQEYSVQPSRRNTQIQMQNQNTENFDIKIKNENSQSLIPEKEDSQEILLHQKSLAMAPSHIKKPNDDHTKNHEDSDIYESKVKIPEVKKQLQFKIPPLSIVAERNETSQQIQRKISAPLYSNTSQNVFNKYVANNYINMKQEQIRVNRAVRQSIALTNAGFKSAIKRNPYKEFFELVFISQDQLCQCVKLNSKYFQEIFYIDTSNLYSECLKTQKPFNEWEDWIRNKLEGNIARKI